MSPQAAPFGSCDFAGSRLVVCQRGESSGDWAACGVFLAGTLISTGEALLFARAIQDPTGQAFIVGAGHDSNQLTVIRGDGKRQTYTVPFAAMNRPCVIASIGDQLVVTYMASPTEVVDAVLDPATLTLAGMQITPCAGTSQGVLDATVAGLELTDPVNRTLAGYTVRYPTTRQGVTLCQAADPRLADGLLVSRDGQLGTVVTGLVMEPHLSEDGARWCGWTQDGRVVSGEIPAVLPALVVTAVPPPVPASIPAPPPWARRFIQAGFFLRRGDESDPTAPFDVEIAANAWGVTGAKPVIAAWVQDAVSAGPLLVATYIDVPTAGYSADDAAAKRKFGKPIVWNYDQALVSVPDRPADFRPGDIESVEIYAMPNGETAAQAIARIEPILRAICDRNRGGTVGFAQCGYTEHLPLALVLELQQLEDGLVARVLRDYPDITFLAMLFAWFRAQYGSSAIPALAQHARDRYAAQPHVPAPLLGTTIAPPLPTLKKPEVSVTSWTLEDLEDGREFVFFDRENPSLNYRVRIWIDQGSMRASISNLAGEGHTDSPRMVKR